MPMHDATRRSDAYATHTRLAVRGLGDLVLCSQTALLALGLCVAVWVALRAP